MRLYFFIYFQYQKQITVVDVVITHIYSFLNIKEMVFIIMDESKILFILQTLILF